MKTPKNKKQKNIPRQPLLRRKGFWFLLLFLAAIAVITPSLLRYQHNHAIEADRIRFERAARDIRSISSYIKTNKVPAQDKYTKNCDYLSKEFEKKPMVCDVSYVASYAVNDVEGANRIRLELGDVLSNNYKYMFKPSDTSRNSESEESTFVGNQKIETLSNTYINTSSGLNCEANFSFFDSNNMPSYYARLASGSNFSIVVLINCGGQAKAAHFGNS
jgi:hypothetical protein